MKITKTEKKRLQLMVEEFKGIKDTYAPTVKIIMKRNGMDPYNKLDMLRALAELAKEVEPK